MVVNLISSHPSAPQDPTSKNQLTARMARGLIYGIRSLIELIYGIRSLIELIYGIRFSVSKTLAENKR